MKNQHRMYLAIAGSALLMAAASAQTPAPQNPNPHSQGTPQTTANRMSADSGFVTKAAAGGLAEVELGKLAASKASNDKVKQFGQRMVDDHTKANTELSQLASQKGITIPTSMTSKDQALHDKLSKQSGAAFDRAYMEHMVSDHRTDVAEFRKESTSGSDPEVKAFAGKTLPTLEEHLKQAEETLNAVKK